MARNNDVTVAAMVAEVTEPEPQLTKAQSDQRIGLQRQLLIDANS